MEFGEIIQGHMFDIAHNNVTIVSRHYNQCPKETPYLSNGMIISVASFIKSPPDTYESRTQRDREEKRWMPRLCSITPKGLNLMDKPNFVTPCCVQPSTLYFPNLAVAAQKCSILPHSKGPNQQISTAHRAPRYP